MTAHNDGTPWEEVADVLAYEIIDAQPRNRDLPGPVKEAMAADIVRQVAERLRVGA